MQPTQTDLSEREQEILKLVVTGASNKEIATTLQISANTVKVHLRNIFSKIGASSRTEAAMYAVNTGLVASIPADNPAQTAAPSEQELPGETVPSDIRDKPGINRRVLGLLILIGLGLAGIILFFVWRQMQNAQAGIATNPVETPRWQFLAPMAAPRSAMAAVAYEDQVYAIGGLAAQAATNSVEYYDPETDVWSSGAPKPTPVYDIQSVVIGGKIFVPGGRLQTGEATNVLEIYDPGLDRWTQGAPLPTGLSAYALAAYEGKMYLFGGWDGKEYVSSVYEYSPEKDAWKNLPPMPGKRGLMGVAVSGRKIFLIGGFDGAKALDKVEVFLPDLLASPEKAWVKGPSLPEASYSMGVASLADFVYAIGGAGEQPKKYPALAYIEQSNEWQTLQNPPEDIGAGLGLVSLGSNLYLVGGLVDGAPSASTLGYKAIYSVSIPIIVK